MNLPATVLVQEDMWGEILSSHTPDVRAPAYIFVEHLNLERLCVNMLTYLSLYHLFIR